MNNVIVTLNTENVMVTVNGTQYIRVYGDTDVDAQEAVGEAVMRSLISLCKEVVQ